MAWLRRRELVELFAVFGFSVAQPILSVFGNSPDAFIYRRADRVDIVAFALVVALAIPIAVWLVEIAVAALSAPTARVFHVAVLAGCVMLWGIQVVADTGARGVLLLGAGALGAGVFTLVYLRWAPMRTFLGFLAVAPVVFVVMFLVTSSTADLLASTAATATVATHSGPSPSVVLVVFDEWPTESVMDAAGGISTAYPNLRAFAATSTWYRNASSVSNSTPYAVPAILTGSLPKPGLPTAANYPHNMFNAFGSAYRLEASESVTALCAADTCRTAAAGSALPDLIGDASDAFGHRISLDRSQREPTTSFVERVRQLGRATATRSVRFDDFLRGFRRDDGPALHVLHVLLPHVPYRFLPSGVQYTAPTSDIGRGNDVWGTDPWPAQLAHQRLLLQAGFVDRMIGELVDRLHATHQFDSSIVAITADHGVEFQPGRSARGLSDAPLADSDLPAQLSAPLLIKAPGQSTGVVSDANVLSIDVLPTLARLAGVELPWPVGGVVAGERRSNEKLFIREASESGVATLQPLRRYAADENLRTLLSDDDVDSLTADPPGSPYRLFNPSGLGGLVGRRVASLSVGAPTSFGVSLSQRDALLTNARSGPTLPAMVSGLSTRQTVIAVVLNGTVAGVAPTFRLGSGHAYTAMVPDALIRARNTVALYEVTGLPDEPVLHAVVRGGAADGAG